jgi:GNAT superfamily N-acetyltransferase
MSKEHQFTIELPEIGDEIQLATMHVQSWKETYVSKESGLTEVMVDQMLSHLLEDTSFRRNTIIEALADPGRVLYRVVKNAAEDVVGFLHGSKDESHNELEAIYLLDEAKGSGVGGRLMEEFLEWIDREKPSHLEVFSFNDSALGFYDKYGFTKTDKKIELYNGILPIIEMVRLSE